MSSRDLIAEWSSEPFLRDATDWVDASLSCHGIVRTGPLHPHKVRFWAAVYQVPTDAGTVWFKACAPPLGHEPALTQAIANVAPHLVLTPLGIDLKRHWMLTPDGGTTLRDRTDSDHMEGLTQAVQVAATMQRDLLPHHEALVAAGLTVLEAADAEEFFRTEVDRLAAFASHHPAHLTTAEARTLQDGWGNALHDMNLLISSGVPSSLQHNDLHDGNIFSHRFRVFDLGDAVWSHPFAVLKVATDHGATRHARDAYLQAWVEYGTLQQLRREADAAHRLGALQQYRTWAVILDVVDHPAMAAQFAFVPRLGDLLGRVVAEDAQRT